MANRKETAEVEIKLTAEEARKQIKQLEGSVKDLESQLKAVGSDDTQRKKLIADLERAESEITKLRQGIKTDMRLIINGEVAEASIKDLRAAIAQLKRELNLINDASNPEFVKKAQQVAELETRVEQMLQPIKDFKAELRVIGEDGSMVQLRAKAEQLKKELDTLAPSTRRFVQASAELNKVETEIEEIGRATKATKAEFTEIGQIGSFTYLKAKAEALRKEIDQLAPSAQEFKVKAGELQSVENQMNRLNTTIKGTGGLWNTLTDSVKQFGLLAAGYLGFQALTSQIQNIITRNAQLSDSLADVMQTTGMTVNEVQELNKQLGKIDTRTSRRELLEIAKVAGQFGEAKENIVNFTNAVNQATVVLKSEFKGGAEEITTTIAGLRNVLTDIKTSRTDQDITHISNALIVLAQQGVATAPVVSDFANRIGGIGIQLGLTSGQVLGLSATLQELNVSTERGGTAIGKILQKMTTDTEQFAKVAGVPMKEFEHMVNTDIYNAFLKFVEGSKRGGESATAFAAILKDSEISGAGASEVVAKLSQNIELLQGRVKLAGGAIEQTGAITEQYALKNDNFAAQLEKLQKRLGGLFSSATTTNFFKDIVEGINSILDTTPAIDKMTEEWRKLSNSTKNLTENINPLLSRYDELKQKTTLSKEEQSELKSIIEQVSKVLPSAVSEFDKYGNALGLNTVKAREFIEAQQQLTEFKNREAIKESETALREYENILASTIRKMNQLVKDGKQQIFDARGNLIGEVKVTNEDIAKLQQQVESYKKIVEGLKLTVREQKGQSLVDVPQETADQLKQIVELEKQAAGIGSKNADDISKRLTVLNEALNKTIAGSEANVRIQKEIVEAQKLLTDGSGGATDEQLKKLDEFKNKYAALLAQLHDLQTASIKDATQKELATIDVKFEREKNAAIKANDEIAHDDKLSAERKAEFAKQTNELLELLEHNRLEERKKIIKAADKELAEWEYTQAVNNLTKWYDEQQTIIIKQYADGIITKKEFDDKSKALEQEHLQYQLNIQKDYGKTTVEVEKQIAENRAKAHEDGVQKIVDTELAQLRFLADGQNDLSIVAFKARMELLKKEAEEEKKLWEGNAQMQALIDADLKQKLLEQWFAYIGAVGNLLDATYQRINATISSFVSANENRENAALAADKRRNDAKRDNLKKSLDAKRISQEQYDKEIAKLDEAYDARERVLKKEQFERHKRSSVAQALINALVSITQTLASAPYPINIGLAALDAIAAYAKVAEIRSQTFTGERGGVLPVTRRGGVTAGPSHANGGIDLIDTVTGEKVGNVQGGEPLLSVETFANNPGIVRELLKASADGGRRVNFVTTEDAVQMAMGFAQDMLTTFSSNVTTTGAKVLVNRAATSPPAPLQVERGGIQTPTETGAKVLVNRIPGLNTDDLISRALNSFAYSPVSFTPQLLADNTFKDLNTTRIIENLNYQRTGFNNNIDTTAAAQQRDNYNQQMLEMMARMNVAIDKLTPVMEKVHDAYADPKQIEAFVVLQKMNEQIALSERVKRNAKVG